jgi:hypothetical protein
VVADRPIEMDTEPAEAVTQTGEAGELRRGIGIMQKLRYWSFE